MSYITGKIVVPHKDKERREIVVDKKLEYDKLPFDRYPITHKNTPGGKGVILINGVHECEASLHRYEKHFYIGSATRRLGSRDYAEMFRRFLERVGTIDKGTLVRLKFDHYRIEVDKI